MKRRRKSYPRTAASNIQRRGYMQRRRKLAKKRWKCQTCFRRPVPPGKTVCAICTRAKSRQERRRMVERHAAGLCMRCGLVPATVRDRLCEDCEVKRTTAPSYGTNATTERRAAENLCRDCGVVSCLDKTRCAGCREIMAAKQKQRAEERIAAGRCYRCGKRPAPKKDPRSACSSCRRKRLVPADRRKTPPPKSLKRCGACGGQGHRRSDAACPLWSSTRPGQART